MKKVIIFGSTGSIGRSALSVIRENRKDFCVKGLCVRDNGHLLREQIDEFGPSYVCMQNEAEAEKFKEFVPSGVKFFYGEKGLEEFSSLSADPR